MNKKINNGLAIILPNKRINLFAIFILILGIISGSIFLIVLKDNDKNMIVEQFNTFIKNVNENNINNSYAFRNALYENYILLLIYFWYILRDLYMALVLVAATGYLNIRD